MKHFISRGEVRNTYHCADVEALSLHLVKHHGWQETDHRLTEFSKLSKGDSTITTHIGGRVVASGLDAATDLDALVSAAEVAPAALDALQRAYNRISLYRASLEMAGAR